MLITMIVTLYTSRIVLNTLGIDDFGIYNIIGGVIILFAFLNVAMSNTTQRFLSFDLGRNDMEQLKKTFSMSMTAHISIAVILFLLSETVGLWFINTQLNIPYERMNAANWVYQFSILTFIFQIIRVPYNASIIAYERMSFYAYISIIEVILKLAVVFLLQQGGFDKLIFYSVLLFIVSIIILYAYKFYCNKKFTISKYIFFWDGNLYKNIMSFSGWSLMGSVASISSSQGINILINIFFGVAVNAAMGIANQVNGALNSFVVNFQTAFKPQIVKSYAEGDKKYLTQLILQTSKFSFFLLFIVSIPILINTDFVLKLWLKQVPEYAVEFCQLIIVYSLMESISGPLWMSVQATGNIRNYQIIISLLFILNLPVSYVFLKLGYNPPVVMFVKIIVDAIVLSTRIIFLKSLLKVSVKQFLQEVFLKIILVVSIVIPISILVKTKFDGWIQVIITTSVSILLTALGIYWIGMRKNERTFIKSAIRKFTRIAKIH